jgi:hypothetical protein
MSSVTCEQRTMSGMRPERGPHSAPGVSLASQVSASGCPPAHLPLCLLPNSISVFLAHRPRGPNSAGIAVVLSNVNQAGRGVSEPLCEK